MNTRRPVARRVMKDSGVAWIGEVPEGWRLLRVAGLYELRNTKCSDKQYAPLSVTMKGVVPQLEDVAKTDDGDNRKLVRKGDFVINSRSDRRGSCGISDLDGSVSLINTVLRPREEMHPGYYSWLFRSAAFADEFYACGHGIVDDLWTTRWLDMKKINVPAPSLPEQSKIADYLDRECGKIDALVAKTEQQIAALEEYKKSVITEAITGKWEKGPKKDSGVEWIGDVPENWHSTRLKYLVKTRSEVSSLESMNGHYIGLENVVSFGGYTSAETEYDRCCYSSCKCGDVLYSKLRPYLAKCIVAPFDACITGEFIDVAEFCGDKRFLRYWFLSSCVTEVINASTFGSKMPRADESFVLNLPFVLPSESIQKKIADSLDGICTKVEEKLAQCHTLLVKMNSYKKSLIFECVTGKREVA